MMGGRKADFIDEEAAMEEMVGSESNCRLDNERLAC